MVSTPDDVLREEYLRYLRADLSADALRRVVERLQAMNEARSLLLADIALVLVMLERSPGHTQTIAAIFELLSTLPGPPVDVLEEAQQEYSRVVYPQWQEILESLRGARNP